MSRFISLSFVISILVTMFCLFSYYKKSPAANIASPTAQAQKYTDVVRNVTAEEVKEIMKNGEKYTLVDVRTKEEYESGHISGAILMPLDTIETKSKDIIDKEGNPIIVYCRSGVRSQSAALKLYELGYKSILNLEGGILKWPYSVEE